MVGQLNKSKNTTHAGTIQYMAPEIVIEENYSGYPADIFSLGVLLFTMVVGHLPFSKPSPKDDKYYQVIWWEKMDIFWKWHTEKKEGLLEIYSESFRELVGSMLYLDPIARPSLSEIRSHEWFNLPVPTPLQVKEEFK